MFYNTQSASTRVAHTTKKKKKKEIVSDKLKKKTLIFTYRCAQIVENKVLHHCQGAIGGATKQKFKIWMPF